MKKQSEAKQKFRRVVKVDYPDEPALFFAIIGVLIIFVPTFLFGLGATISGAVSAMGLEFVRYFNVAGIILIVIAGIFALLLREKEEYWEEI